MFDRYLIAVSKPVVDAIALRLHRKGVNADQISIFGFGCGMCAAVLIAYGEISAAITPLLFNRLLDGLDGAVARLGGPTSRGAFIDVSLDFLFYAAVPLAFAFCDPDANALAASVLLAAFIGTGTSFLAYAVIAEKLGHKSSAYPSKGFYYLGGLTEGFETVVCFMAMCLWPQYFALLAYVYAGMCSVTTFKRILAGWRSFASASK